MSIKGFQFEGDETIHKYDYESLDNKLQFDETLTQTRKIPDSKKVGDAITDLKEDLTDVINGAYTITDNLVDFTFDFADWLQGMPTTPNAVYAIYNKNKVALSEGDTIYSVFKNVNYEPGTIYTSIWTYDSSDNFVENVNMTYKNNPATSYTVPSGVAYCYVGFNTRAIARPITPDIVNDFNADIYIGKSEVTNTSWYPKYISIKDTVDEIKSDVDAIKDFVSDLSGIPNISVGGIHIISSDDVVDFYDSTVINYRIGTPTILQFDRDITLTPESGYRMYFYVKASGESSYTGTGWKTAPYTIPANAKWGVNVAKVTEDTSVPADLETFAKAVKTSVPISTLKTKVDYLNEKVTELEEQTLDVSDINVKYIDRIDALTQLTRMPMFLVFTDIHGFGGYLERIGDFHDANLSTYCKDVICLGDMVHDRFSDDFTFMSNSDFGKTALVTIGNHDCYDGTTVGGVPRADMYAKFFTNVSLWGVTQPANASANGYMYYYKDYDSKIRLIVLDEYYWDSTQLAWFESTLESARTAGLTVIVAQHEGNFTELEYAPLVNHAFGTEDRVFIRMTNGYTDRRNAVDAFVSAGGKFVGWINGHTHCEQFGTFEVNGNKQFNMTFSNSGQDITSRMKIPNYSQDCFYYLAVDADNSRVYVLTIGQASNKWFKRNLMLAYDYANQEVIHYY